MKGKGAYSVYWKEIADLCKSEAKWNCIRCKHANDRESGHVLTVHHFDGDKSNNRWWNLLALCQRCHLSFQGRVNPHVPYMFEHSEWLKPYVAGFYAWKYCKKELSRFEVEHKLEELLDLERLA